MQHQLFEERLDAWSEDTASIAVPTAGPHDLSDFSVLLDGIAGQCALLLQDGRILSVNREWDAFARANGYQAGDRNNGFGVGRNYLGICSAASGECSDEALPVFQGLQSVLEGATDRFELEYPCHSPDEKRWFKCQVRRLQRMHEGQFLAIVQHVDVTDQVRGRLDAEASKQRIELYADGLGLHWWRFNLETETFQMSAALSEKVGIDATKPMSVCEWCLRIHPDDRKTFLTTIRQVGRTGLVAEPITYRVQGDDGGLHRLTCIGWSSAQETSGDRIVDGLVVDATAEWVAMRELSALNLRIRSLIEQLPIRVACIDRSMRYRFVNPAFAKGVEKPADALAGIHVNEVLSTASFHELEGYMKRALAGETVTVETEVTLHTGKSMHAIISYLPDTTDDGAPNGFYAVIQDVGELKQRESELQRAKEVAERASRAKSDFLACMSHELRTPLNAIIGFSEVIGRADQDGILAEHTGEYAGYIRDSGQSLLSMVNQLLDLSAIEAGRYPFRFVDLSLCDSVRECSALVRRDAEARGLSVTVNLPETPVTIRADAQALRQVILNLAGNALKFTQEGGIAISVEGDGAQASLSVRDTGIGMSESFLALLRKPFAEVRETAPRTERSGETGWGLGVSITRQIIDAHGGTITFDSTPGKGTTVQITLPQLPAGA
jgi:PAS domain S-box-containing protein